MYQESVDGSYLGIPKRIVNMSPDGSASNHNNSVSLPPKAANTPKKYKNMAKMNRSHHENAYNPSLEML